MTGCHARHFDLTVLAAVLLSTASCSFQDQSLRGVIGWAAPEEVAEQGIAELRAQAEEGLAEAQVNLGDRYRYGRGVTQDEAVALAWYRRAAEQGHAEAQVTLGSTYTAGRGVEPDEVEALRW